MKISDTKPEAFLPHDEGNFPGVCVAVADLGICKTKFGPKDKFLCLFATGEIQYRKNKETGEYDVPGDFYVLQYRCNKGWGAKSGQQKLIEALGTKASDVGDDDELESHLLGKTGMLAVEHSSEGDKTYANINGISKVRRDKKTGAVLDKVDLSNFVLSRYAFDMLTKVSGERGFVVLDGISIAEKDGRSEEEQAADESL